MWWLEPFVIGLSIVWICYARRFVSKTPLWSVLWGYLTDIYLGKSQYEVFHQVKMEGLFRMDSCYQWASLKRCCAKLLSKSKWKHLFQLLVTFFVILTWKCSPVLLKLWPLHPPRSFLTFLFFLLGLQEQLATVASCFHQYWKDANWYIKAKTMWAFLVHLILLVRQNESLAVHLALRKVQIVFHPEITNCFAT